jgi:hypothetical protein
LLPARITCVSFQKEQLTTGDFFKTLTSLQNSSGKNQYSICAGISQSAEQSPPSNEDKNWPKLI